MRLDIEQAVVIGQTPTVVVRVEPIFTPPLLLRGARPGPFARGGWRDHIERSCDSIVTIEWLIATVMMGRLTDRAASSRCHASVCALICATRICAARDRAARDCWV